MLKISHQLSIPDREIEISAIRSRGAGGQNVNKVSSAIHLRFNINTSSLPESCKRRLLAMQDHRLTRNGIIIIKAQRYRSQGKNREEALQRLQEMIFSAMTFRKKRIATRASHRSELRRLDNKVRRGHTKTLRRKIL